MIKRYVRTLAVAALALVLPVAYAPAATGDTSPDRPGPIVWGDCPAAPAGMEIDPKQRCGTLKVPHNHRDPRGRTIEIAVSRIPAADPARRRGALLLNPGGPGGEGLHLPSEFGRRTSGAVRDVYDLIGFDPRGVGRSTPVTCGLTAGEMVPNTPHPDADGSIRTSVAFARSAAARCAARSGDLLPFITTAATARDMDLIRRALGERRISYYGGSYGTYLGAVYASLFPKRADRVVLDSAVDPDRIWYDEFRGQSAGMAKRFPDAARHAAENHATIGLGDTARQVTAAYLALGKRLDAKPVRIPGSPTMLTGNVLRFITFNLLYQDAALTPLAQSWRAAADLAAGKGTAEQAELLKLVLAKLSPVTSPGVPTDNTVAAAYAVVCGDARWPKSVAAYAKNVAADLAAYPLSGGSPAGIWPCAFWKAAPVEPPVAVTGHGPRGILILQNERDPATSLASGRGMREALGARAALVTVDAGGHGVYGLHGKGACADKVALISRGIRDVVVSSERMVVDSLGLGDVPSIDVDGEKLGEVAMDQLMTLLGERREPPPPTTRRLTVPIS
ncbi:alpha/beta fold hydrolase [Nonomuraea sp. K274]|uniref:Alpha/beta fold hydrolase n=1 Tax=Nonomuraea cypriaca TaxID=1187855 RepID=A0A931A1F8_9ACTN|nr:alpha/beta fold hydrolase [Nonomuraea cypriaca]MBF8184437.1 alpha/beta fold hydrolase [Nonomuraea cypriaca]